MSQNIIENMDVSFFIADIYQYAQNPQQKDFKHYVFSQLRHIVSFNYALWISQTDQLPDIKSENCYSYVLPPIFAEKNKNFILQLKDELLLKAEAKIDNNPLQQTLQTTLKDIDIFTKQCYGDKLTETAPELFNYPILLNLHRSQHHHLENLLMLFNHVDKPKFTLMDTRILHMVIPHIIESQKIFIKTLFHNKLHKRHNCDAIFDLNGDFIEADDSFIKEIGHLVPNSAIPSLGLDLKKYSGAQYYKLGNHHRLRLVHGEGFVYAQLIKEHKPIKLSKRELQIAKLLEQGLSDKAIGVKLDISHYTVNNHIKNIFQKLNVNSRGAIVVQLLEDGVLT